MAALAHRLSVVVAEALLHRGPQEAGSEPDHCCGVYGTSIVRQCGRGRQDGDPHDPGYLPRGSSGQFSVAMFRAMGTFYGFFWSPPESDVAGNEPVHPNILTGFRVPALVRELLDGRRNRFAHSPASKVSGGPLRGCRSSRRSSSFARWNPSMPTCTASRPNPTTSTSANVDFPDPGAPVIPRKRRFSRATNALAKMMSSSNLSGTPGLSTFRRKCHHLPDAVARS